MDFDANCACVWLGTVCGNPNFHNESTTQQSETVMEKLLQITEGAAAAIPGKFVPEKERAHLVQIICFLADDKQVLQ